MNAPRQLKHGVRRVRAEDWPAVRELRLAALLDPLAPLAFLESYANAAGQPEVFWQDRARNAAEGAEVAQFVAERVGDGRWDGTVTVLIEEAGSTDPFGLPVVHRQAHLVGVFVRAGARGSGLAEALFRAAVEWAREVAAVERVRLLVHERNARAEGFYRRFGFVPSGVAVPEPDGAEANELEYVLRPSVG
ncbi:acetyltransferase [Streptomyces albus]|uniref:Acetyltransferase n=1 Tax=Streptomyces albus (strain ATCC 21838 / DSM 41398 / FERM P-419 / JCM 4703 / NBRC 107858) TaxID=1081613 RepID=A0A0B5ENX2_STRA4|nr:acetyltransferase [Streptomyces albus]AOU78704.1 acetyltransferase [Streptomyces albus]AYN34440.1 N-acetyltransferase [Streptomyces albus]